MKYFTVTYKGFFSPVYQEKIIMALNKEILVKYFEIRNFYINHLMEVDFKSIDKIDLIIHE